MQNGKQAALGRPVPLVALIIIYRRKGSSTVRLAQEAA